MSALDRVELEGFPWPKELIAGVRAEIAKHLWAWYREHENDVLFERKVLKVIPIRIRVGDCRLLLEMLLGPAPVTA